MSNNACLAFVATMGHYNTCALFKASEGIPIVLNRIVVMLNNPGD
jgi:hypothetical protein